MGIAELERELKLIRKIMESSSRYTNIPAAGYIGVGIVGTLGALATFLLLTPAQRLDVTLLSRHEAKYLTLLWSCVLMTAILTLVFFSWQKAKQHQVAAWNSLAARMVLSQVPLVLMAGILTGVLALKGHYDLIPGVWLGLYGVVLYSFSYFTGFEHKVESSVFIFLGTVALCVSFQTAVILLGLGFGGIHILAGIWRIVVETKGVHESDGVK